MRRVVVTGMGIVSSIGNNTQEVLASLREAKSGITHAEEFAKRGFRCQVQGMPTLDPAGSVDRRAMRFLGQGAAWNHVAMEQAIRDSGVEEKDISNPRTGIVMGSGGPSTATIVEAADITREKGSPKRIGPFAVPKAMSSTASATLSTWFKIKGVNYSISSACATSNHCIGNGTELIQWGKQDMVFAGGSEELSWTMSNLFDAMGAMSSKYTDTPQKASRAYDKDRDGFVIAGGAGVLVLEELEHAKARGAKIYAELVGYGLSGDAYHITAPSPDGDGAFRCMSMAVKRAGISVDDIDYINAHGTSTPLGDEIELGAVQRVVGNAAGRISMSSTKSCIGHLLGAAGAVEAIFSILAIRDGVAPPTINLDNPSVETPIDLVPHVARKRDINTALSNSFGFGGTNASLIFSRYAG
jgi:3-oxoacyl-[acyl-carrier-protein] synthase-1